MMLLTRSFWDPVANLTNASPGFHGALVEEAVRALAGDDIEIARTLLCDVAN